MAQTDNTNTPAAQALTESAPRQLSDTHTVKLQLVESAPGEGKTGKIFVRGEFGRANSATENKRLYPESLWRREFSRLDESITKRQVFGECDHPADGRTSLQRVSHVITNLQLNNEGIVMGEAEILDTERGRNIAALLRAGCSVGVSSRGYGSVKPNDKGQDVVQEDYRLVTYDFVAEPADTKALPQAFFESKQNAEKSVEQQLAEQQETLRNEFSKDLLVALTTLKAESKAEARAELLADPEVAASKHTLDRILDIVRPMVVAESSDAAIQAKNVEIAALKSELDAQTARIHQLETETAQLAEAAKEVGYQLFVERQIAGDSDADFLRDAVGDVTQYEKLDAISERISEIRADLKVERDAAAEKEKERQALISKVKAEAESRRVEAEAVTEQVRQESKKHQEKAAKLEEALEKTIESQRAMAVKLYSEKKLTNHPKASKVRSILESSHPTSKDEVDEILNSFNQEPVRHADQVESVRSRVRSLTKGGLGSTALDEEAPAPSSTRSGQSNFANLGVSIAELQKLSGIE